MKPKHYSKIITSKCLLLKGVAISEKRGFQIKIHFASDNEFKNLKKPLFFKLSKIPYNGLLKHMKKIKS